MENDDTGFQLAIKAITGLMTEQRTTHSLLERQSANTEQLRDQVTVLGDQVTVLAKQVTTLGQQVNTLAHRVDDLTEGQHGLVQSSQRSLQQQQLLLDAMTGFAGNSTQTQRRLARVEREIEELKRRFREAS